MLGSVRSTGDAGCGGQLLNKKTVTCISVSPGAVYREYKTLWDDVWLRLWNRRRRVYLGPCVMSLEYARQEIKIAKSVEKMGVEHGCADDPCEMWGSIWWSGIVARLESGREEIIIFNSVGIDDYPNIVVAKDLLTRKDIEEALRFYLRQIGCLKGAVRFRWKKPRLFIASG